MSKFKIGDKVKIIGNTYSSINQIGDIGIILDTIIARSLIKVHSQIPLRPNDDNWVYESDIELYVEESVLPKYVECIKEEKYGFYGKLGTVYKVDNWNYSVNDCWLEGTTSRSTCKDRFKPSTKEAYDAQFVVKEPEFVLPDKWAIRQNSQIINDWLNKNSVQYNTYRSLSGNDFVHFPSIFGYHLFPTVGNDYTEITLEQFKKYVLKEETIQLPKVIETTNIITTIECVDGNIFKIGDFVKATSYNGSTWYEIMTINSIEIKDNEVIFNNFINADKVQHHIPLI